MPHLIATALVGGALALLPAVPAQAAPGTSLRLTLTYPGNDTSAAPGNGTSGTRTVTLRCGPAGGNHPKAARACTEIDAAGGRLAHAPDDRVCTAIYAPVVAQADGHWRGRAVDFRAEYGNDCAMRSRTGTIFDF
ncbi:SSI family serine proteinase inhibitor [Actinomadura rubrisoli]|uniref:Serine protease n=1 Tax=Actinomadura rubrisoli TaxID=2530368 RepID=A0A4R5CB89_9ACTN|nr:SSI family serine proteinase inhibitor [Actinomadura rubrisoli]TDD95463.1 serine protease [Actinomadura rubrisoli]